MKAYKCLSCGRVEYTHDNCPMCECPECKIIMKEVNE